MSYTNIGTQIPGTKFIPFKVPLKNEISKNLPVKDRFTPADLLDKVPHLKLIVNLTNANDGRYYNYYDFKCKGIEIIHIRCQGHGILPQETDLNRFFNAVDNFMSTATDDSDESLIGVHCTHGLNRTGYFICRYMSDRMTIPANNAIKSFESARGHEIVRELYKKDLLERSTAETSGNSQNRRHNLEYESPLGNDYNTYNTPYSRYRQNRNQQSRMNYPWLDPSRRNDQSSNSRFNNYAPYKNYYDNNY